MHGLAKDYIVDLVEYAFKAEVLNALTAVGNLRTVETMEILLMKR